MLFVQYLYYLAKISWSLEIFFFMVNVHMILFILITVDEEFCEQQVIPFILHPLSFILFREQQVIPFIPHVPQ